MGDRPFQLGTDPSDRGQTLPVGDGPSQLGTDPPNRGQVRTGRGERREMDGERRTLNGSRNPAKQGNLQEALSLLDYALLG